MFHVSTASFLFLAHHPVIAEDESSMVTIAPIPLARDDADMPGLK
jgi:hypothetical protein